jgi:hypothetical protein
VQEDHRDQENEELLFLGALLRALPASAAAASTHTA